MAGQRGYRIERFTGNRQVVAAASAVSRETNTIHLVSEVAISEPRRLITEYRERTGERLSLTGYVVACLARTVAEFPQFNSFRKGSRLFVFDEVTVGVLYEREMDGERAPESVPIRDATAKTYRQISDEIRAVQSKPAERVGSGSGMAWIRFIPGFLLRTFVRLANRSVAMKRRFGVLGVTAVGMHGSGAMWLVPLSSATVALAVGSVVRRPVGTQGVAEHLCVTLSFDHDIVDGAPAARFAARFAEHVSSGDEVRQAIAVDC